MKLSELIVPVTTFLGGVVSALITASWIYAGTERQTDVQLVQLAIGILSEPVVAPTGGAVGVSLTSQTALRTWAVDIINKSAEVKFDAEAKHLLVNGDANFPDNATRKARQLDADIISGNVSLEEAIARALGASSKSQP